MGRLFDEYMARGGEQAVPQPATTTAGPKAFGGAYASRFMDYLGTEDRLPQGPLLMEGTYTQWYTGRNLEGEANGWNTEFMRASQEGLSRAYQTDNVFDYFQQKDANGVVTWDGAKDSQGKELSFGDIVVNGMRKGNVYEDVDRHTANVMMGEWLITDGREKARLGGDTEEWDARIQRFREENTKQAEVAPRAREFQEGIEDRAEAFDDQGWLAAGGAAGGAALGATTGAVVGSIVPGFGTAIGAIVGGVGGAIAGGFGSWLNQDSLAYQISRTNEMAERAQAEGMDAYLPTVIEQVTQNAYAVAMNPLQNLVQGATDALTEGYGNPADGGAFQALDPETGERKAGMLAQGANFVASIGDAFLQFASPAARAAYTAQMSAQILSKSAGLLPGVGQFDMQSMTFDSVWTTDEGKPDPVSATAGVASVGIDLVQLGGLRGLLGASTREAGRVGKTRVFGEWGEGKAVSRWNLDKQQKQALADGGELQTMAGYKFVTDSAGNIVGKQRATMAMLAPSEALQALSVKVMARRDTERYAGALRAEDLYNAAANLAVGERKVTSALVNAFGEMQEEALQGLLDPISKDNAVDANEVIQGAMMGFASGLGMGIASGVTAPSQDQKLFSMAQMAHSYNRPNDAPLTRDDWTKMSQVQRRQLVKSMPTLASEVMKSAVEKMTTDRTEFVHGRVVAAEALSDYRKKVLTGAQQFAASATDQAMTIVRIDEAQFRYDAVATSHTQLLRDQKNRTKGIAQQMTAIAKQLDGLASKTDTASIEQIAKLQTQQQSLRRMGDASVALEQLIERKMVSIEQAFQQGRVAAAEGEVAALNQQLRDLYDMKLTSFLGSPLSDEERSDVAKAVSRISTRDPNDSTGSWQTFVPQVDAVFSQQHADGVAAISQIALKALRGDYDGDKVRHLQQLMLDDSEYIALRSGQNKLGATTAPEISTTESDAYISKALRRANKSRTTAIRNMVATMLDGIERDLRDWYANPSAGRDILTSKVIDDVMNRVRVVARDGGDVRGTLLQEMESRAGAELTKVGRGELPSHDGALLSDEKAKLASMVSRHMQDFASGYAAVTPGTRSMEPDTDVVAPTQFSTEQRARRAKRAATWSGTLMENLSGSNLFRMFQKIHYSKYASTDAYSGWASGRTDFSEAVEEYALQSRGATTDTLRDIPANDEIVARVLKILQKMAINPETGENLTGIAARADMVLMANTMVRQFEYRLNPDTNRTEAFFTGKYVTQAQQLLYQSLQQYKQDMRRKDIWETDPDVQSAYNNLIELTRPPRRDQKEKNRRRGKGNAEAAFVAVFNSMRMADLLGESALTLGAQLTVGQFYRSVLDLSPAVRMANREKLKLEGEYLPDVTEHQVPYSADAVENGEVTAYRTLVDSVFGAAQSQVSINQRGPKAGKVTGRLAERSDKTSEQFVTSHTSVRELFRRLTKKRTLTAQDVADLAESNPQFGRALYAMIPDNVMPFVFKGEDKDGYPQFASWFYRVFAEKDAKKAEMIFWRGIILDSWYAKSQALDVDEATEQSGKVQKINYHSLDNRFHQLMFRLGTDQHGGQLAFNEFLAKINSADTVDSFIDWLNDKPDMVGNKAPFLPWVYDTAEFDATKTGSGWTRTLSRPMIMENLRQLQSISDRAVSEIDRDQELLEQDQPYVDAILRYHAHLKGEPVTLGRHDETYYRQFEAALKQARKRELGYGPRAMLTTVAVTLYGLYGKAHTKGANPEHMAAEEVLAVWNTAFGFETNPERVLSDLTSHDEADVAGNAALIMRDGGRMMDSDGAEATWSEQTMDSIVPMLDDPSKRDLVRMLVFPQVVELKQGYRAQRELLFGRSIKSLLENSGYKDLYSDSGNPSFKQAMKYLAALEMELHAQGKAFNVRQTIFDLALARTTAAGDSLDFSDVEELTNQAAIDIATVLQDLGRTRPDADGTDPAAEAMVMIRDVAKMAAAASRYKITDPKLLTNAKDLKILLESMIDEKYQARLDSLDRVIQDPASTPQQRQDAMDVKDKQLDFRQRERDWATSLLDTDVLQNTIDTYEFNPKALDKAAQKARKRVLIDYVYNNQELLQGAGPAFQMVQDIKAWHEEKRRDRKRIPLDFSDEDWQQLSQVIISVDVQRQMVVGIAENMPPPLPSEPTDGGFDKRQYFDPSFSWLVSFIDPANGYGVLEATRELAVRAGKVNGDIDAKGLVRTVRNRIFSPETQFQWTEVVPAAAIESYDLLNGSSASPVISMAGKLTERWGAAVHATARTYRMADPALDSTTSLTWDDLNWENVKRKPQQASMFHTVQVIHPTGAVQRPFQQLSNRFARSVTLSYDDPAGGKKTVDLMKRADGTEDWSIVRPYAGSEVSPDLREVHMGRMRDEIERRVNDGEIPKSALASLKVDMQFVHPDMQPTEVDRENPGTSFYNNLWYEGTAFASDGDTSFSLLAMLFFGVGGINPTTQQAALDTRKKGLAGLERLRKMNRTKVAALEAGAATDFAAMLLGKTQIMLETPVTGGKPLHEDFFNGVYKLMKLTHWLQGRDEDGNWTRWSAEQVIEWQLKNPAEAKAGQLPLRDAKLWIPSNEVLADMMGDIGFGGTNRRLIASKGAQTDLTAIPQFEGWTPEMEERFPSAPRTLDWLSTSVARQAHLHNVTFNLEDPATRSKRGRRVERMHRQRITGLEERRKDHTFNAKATVDKAREFVYDALSMQAVDIKLPPEWAWAGMSPAQIADETQLVINAYLAGQQQNSGYLSAAFVYQNDMQGATASAGTLSNASLTNRLHLVAGDMVIIDVSSFDNLRDEEARAEAMKVLAYFVNRNVAISLVSSTGRHNLTHELQAELRERFGYQRYKDNAQVLVPDLMLNEESQNVAAAQSHLVAIDDVPIADQRVVLLTPDREVEENTLWTILRDGRSRLDSLQTVTDALPGDVNHTFGPPQTQEDAEMVLNWVGSLNTQHLIDRTIKDPSFSGDAAEYAADFHAAWKRLLNRLPDAVEKRATTEPGHGDEFGFGDFIPYLSFPDNELFLYRQGYEYPRENIERQMGMNDGSVDGPQYVAVAQKPARGATVRRGTVDKIEPSQNFGRKIKLMIPAPAMGQKTVVEGNGMKYLQTHVASDTEVPAVNLMQNVPLDGIGALADVIAKEALKNAAVNFRNAFAFFGFDATPALEKVFGSRDKGLNIMRALERSPDKISIPEAYELQSLMSGDPFYFSMLAQAVPIFDANGAQSLWTGLMTEQSAEAAIVRAMVVYLMSPGAKLKHILKTSGLNVDDPNAPGAVTQKMPALFTRAFDIAQPDSAVKDYFEADFNKKLEAGPKLASGPRAGKREGWSINVNTWQVIGRTKGQRPLIGILQFGEFVVSDDNPELSVQAMERKQNQSASVHAALVNSFGTGAQVQARAGKTERLERTLARQPVREDGSQVWRDLTNIDPATASSGAKWQQRYSLEHGYEQKALARFAAYRQPIDMSGEEFDEYRTRIEVAKNEVLALLGMDEKQSTMVDYWIRQLMHRPAALSDQADFADTFWPPHILDVLDHMRKNLELGYFPTYDGVGPGMISEPDLAVMFRAAQRQGEAGWSPRRIEGDPDSGVGTASYADWVAAAFGQGINSDVRIDPVILIDLDGMMNTYRPVIRKQGHMLDTSLDKELMARLIDPTNNELHVTMSPVNQLQLLDTILLAANNISIDNLRRGIPTAQDPLAKQEADGWRTTSRKRTSRWRARNKIRPAEMQSTRDMVRTGQTVIGKNADMHSLQRIAIALRHGTAMLNPGLYVSMLPEQGMRSLIAQTTNVLTGTATSSVLGATTAKLGLNAYTPEQVDRLNNLYRSLGNNGKFTALIVKDLMWQKPEADGGRVVRLAEKYASFGNYWQDPTWGTTQTAMARRYVEAVLRAIEATPIRNSMTTDAVIAHLSTDPMFFEREHPEIHLMASNEVVDYRGLKQTPYSLAARRIYEPWSNSSNIGKRFIGTILKMSLMYTTYNANMLTTVAGLQGYNQILSVFLDKRRTPGTLINRAVKKMLDKPITAEDDKQFDMSSTLDGYSVANAFIRGGVTHTGLFMLGMISANGLSLTGEDEEARRRRRLAEMQKAPLYADPRRLETDFRNKDMIFLDFLPPQLNAFFRLTPGDDAQGPRSGVQISWLLKPFFNPIIGMERFFQTGDFSEITNAFIDAAGSLPLFNARSIDDAVRTSDELAALAAEQDEVATPTSTKNSLWFLTSAVAVLERMLFENLFVNSLYTGFDTWDRDPTQMVLRDSDGDIQRMTDNSPRQNDQALTAFVDPETGQVREAYAKRNPVEANIAAYAENNATFAAVMSLFTGFDKDYWRYNQAVRIQKIDMPEVEDEGAKAMILAAMKQAWAEDGVVERELSLTEVTNYLRNEFIQKGDWDSYNDLDRLALQTYESAANPVFDPLSKLNEKGEEVLTTPGAIAIFKGLENGTITLDDPALRRIGITREMREQIEAEFYADTVAEGESWGLTKTMAQQRAKRLLLGPTDNPSIRGFKDLLWDDRIPYNADAKYKQLNTTYVQGPDGYPWATGFKRGGFWTTLGIPQRPTLGMHSGTGVDGRMNTTDQVRGINTGLRGLVPMDESELLETDIEQTDRLERAIKGIRTGDSGYEPFDKKSSDSGYNKGRFYKRYGYRRWGSGGRRSYGGGYGSSPNIYYSRQYTLPRNTNSYGGSVRNIFWDRPTIRRHTIRRERYQSSRGRLNQWQ